MCGIVTYVGKDQNSDQALQAVVKGLERLEYRGYDSAGVALLENSQLEIYRAKGKLAELKKNLVEVSTKSQARLAIGHTRWATHGKPAENNAHPHSTGRVSIVHNGIVENYRELKNNLVTAGANFTSETDSEVVAHLFDRNLDAYDNSLAAFSATCQKLEGSYALVALCTNEADKVFLAKNQSPLVIGVGEGFNMAASDLPAILEYTRQVIFLEEGDIALLSADKIEIYNQGALIERPVQHIAWDLVTAQKGGYKHYMLKEIFEQPRVISDTFLDKINFDRLEVFFEDQQGQPLNFQKYSRLTLTACGTAFYAALLGKYYFEKLAGIPCDVDYASEYRYRSPIIDPKSLLIAISQSGETADTLAAVNYVKGKSESLSICNVLGSSLTRRTDQTIFTHAGPEISVASTKAFSTQLEVLYLLALYAGFQRQKLSLPEYQNAVQSLMQLPQLQAEFLSKAEEIEVIARKLHSISNCLYIGRGLDFPIALEGALKLKEVSYVHAEAYPAGELKHGPLALIDNNMWVVVLLPRDKNLFDKTYSNLLEIKAREGKVLAVCDGDDSQLASLKAVVDELIVLPYISCELSPLMKVLPLQLLAYYIALFNGTDVDQPRNLAKSVTVE